MNAHFIVPQAVNEPLVDYRPGSPARASLKKELERQASMVMEIPLIIAGKEIRTGKIKEVVMPHDHGHLLARVHQAGEKEIRLP